MAKAEDVLKAMSLEEKIGQMVIAGLDGLTADEHAEAMLAKYRVGGFVFFARNIQDSRQALALVNSLKALNKRHVPLFLAIDEEGGRVTRLPAEYRKLPASRSIGDTGSVSLAYEVGGILADRVKSLGFNMDFAPVLDINSNPDNPVIGDRSLGTTAQGVTGMGIAVMKGIQAGNIIPVVKHFPGHGDTAVDSHKGLPRVEADMDRLESFELVPFRAAVTSQADMVMTAHILLPRIDPKHPATLSKPIITGILRNLLGFQGVVITDDLNMAAVKDNYDLGDAAVLAVNAGVDIVLTCHEYANLVHVISALRNAVEGGLIPAERIEESVLRILRLKQKYTLTNEAVQEADIEQINRRADEALRDR